MSMNGHVRFHGGSLASRRGMGMIYHLGVIEQPPPIIKTEEAVGLVGGAGLIGLGIAVKGKGGMVLGILGGLAALISGGMAAMRAISPPAPSVVGPAVIMPAAPPPPSKPASSIPGLPSSATAIIQQLAPYAKELFEKLKPSDSTPSAIITKLPDPGTPSSGGGIPGLVTSYN